MNSTPRNIIAIKLAWQTKLQSGLKTKDHSRVRDYISQLMIDYPDVNQCPVDRPLLDQAVDFVLQKYCFNPEAKSLQEIFYRKQ